MKNGENKRFHIQMIENIIDRMARNSFLIRGWFLTLFGGLMTFYFTNMDKSLSWIILMLCFLICLIFWCSDTFYLKSERNFRKLYDFVIKKDDQDIDFSMKFVDSSKEKFWSCFKSSVMLMFYAPIVVFIIVLWISVVKVP